VPEKTRRPRELWHHKRRDRWRVAPLLWECRLRRMALKASPPPSQTSLWTRYALVRPPSLTLHLFPARPTLHSDPAPFLTQDKCVFQKPDGEQCRRNRANGRYCWQHSLIVRRNLDVPARIIEDNIPHTDLCMQLREDAERKAKELVPQLFRSVNPHFVDITTEVFEDEVIVKYKRKDNDRIVEAWRDAGVQNEALRQRADDLLSEIEEDRVTE
jgi:hypothetical protein